MAARLDAMTGSSSTTKMREPGDMWSQVLYFSVRKDAEGLSGISLFLGQARILVSIAHSLGAGDSPPGSRDLSLTFSFGLRYHKAKRPVRNSKD
jgi:hypothetical protein